MHEESDDGNVMCVLFVYACLCDAYLDMVDSMWPILVNVYTEGFMAMDFKMWSKALLVWIY